MGEFKFFPSFLSSHSTSHVALFTFGASRQEEKKLATHRIHTHRCLMCIIQLAKMNNQKQMFHVKFLSFRRMKLFI